MRLHLDTSELDELANYWQQSPELVGNEVARFMGESTEHLEGEWKERAPTGASQGNGGGYRSSISAQPVARRSDRIIGVVGTSSPYAIPIELGTKPHMPPLEPLADWVQVVLGEEPYTLNKKTGELQYSETVWAVAMSIKKKGTKPKYIARNVWKQNQSQLRHHFGEMLVRVRNKLGKDLH